MRSESDLNPQLNPVPFSLSDHCYISQPKMIVWYINAKSKSEKHTFGLDLHIIENNCKFKHLFAGHF